MTELRLPESVARADLGAFAARVVRLDQTAQVRLRSAVGWVTAWSMTPFDVLVTRSVRGTLAPADVTIAASALLTALAVDRSDRIDPGRGNGRWAGELPPDDGWSVVDDVPAADLEGIADLGLALVREHGGAMGPSASLLDQTVLTVTAANVSGLVRVPLRALFALSGMGFLGGADTGVEPGAPVPVVRVSATGSWVRLDARYGAVVRRRIASLPLFPS